MSVRLRAAWHERAPAYPIGLFVHFAGAGCGSSARGWLARGGARKYSKAPWLAWIDIGSPSAERLHKASKAARRVALFTHVELALLRREAATRAIHKVEDIEVWRFSPAFLDALEAKVGRSTQMELTRTDGQLYVTLAGETLEAALARESLVEDAAGRE